MRRQVFLLAAMIGLTMTGGNIAFAACSNPSGSAGKMIYNTDHSMAQYCDGTNWIAMGNTAVSTPSLPSSSLVAHWKLDEASGTSIADSSGNSHSGTMSGGMDAGSDSVSGQIGTALDFDGTNDCIGLGTFDVSGSAMTIAGWLYFTVSGGSASADDRFISKSTGSAEADHYWMVSESGNKLRFRLKTDGTTTTLVAPSVTLPVNTWVHFVALYDGAEMRLYQDGVEVGSAAKTGTISTNGSVNVAMGCSPEGSNYMDGQLDDVRIYDRALSDSEIATLASVTERNLVAHWKLDEASGTTAADSSGNGNDGTMQGGLSASSNSVTGKIGSALDFDGVDDYVDAGTSLDITGVKTASLWIKVSTLNNDRIAFYSSDGTENDFLAISVWNNRIYAVADNVYSAVKNKRSSITLSSDTWYHVTVVKSVATVQNIYINGVDVTQDDGDYYGGGVAGTYLGGAPSTADYTQGALDDVRIYNRVMTADEIKYLYACSSPGHVEYNLDDHVMQFCSDQGLHAMGPVSDCLEIGDVCKDGSIFAGDTNLYVTDANQSAAAAWKTSTGINDINPDSLTDGQANHDNRAGTLSDFPAFELCENLTRHGHSDWYLPALNELNTLYLNQAAINASASENFVTASAYWSSTENSTTQAKREIFSTGTQGNTTKTSTRNVRCVRRGTATPSWKPHPVGWWKLDETSGTTAADSSGNGNDGTMGGGLSATNDSVTGQVDGALDFDGSNDYIKVTSNPGLSITSSYTFTAWINTNTVSGGDLSFMLKFESYYFQISNDELSSGFYNGGWLAHTTTSLNLSTGVWYHVAAVFDDTANTYKMYVNGTEILNEAENSAPASGGDLFIGATNISFEPWNGKIDDVRIYNKALSLSEVQAIYNNTPDCTNPDGIEGAMIYNTDDSVMQYCNGTEWIGIGK